MSSKLYIAGLFGCHATSSVSMILLNKEISQNFNLPWTTIFIQNVGTVLLGYLYGHIFPKKEKSKSSDELGVEDPPSPSKSEERRRILGMTVPRQPKNRLWLAAQTFFFVWTLFTSLKALHYISVPLYVVARNSVPACTAMLEYLVDRTTTGLVGMLGLCLTVLGAVIYTASDDSFEFTGFTYAIAQVLIVACCSAVDKTSVRIQSKEEGILPVEVNQIRVALSMPINVLLILALELDGGAAAAEAEAPVRDGGLFAVLSTKGAAVLPWLLLSTVFGFGMGTFNFNLQREVNATTVQVANISYKLVTTILSRVTHPAPVTQASWMGYMVSLAGIAIYTFGPRLFSEGGFCGWRARKGLIAPTK